MNRHVTTGFLPGSALAGADLALPGVVPLERRRLQCYLALLFSDMAALFSGFAAAGWLYLGPDGLAQGSHLAQLLLPIFLTVALYNGTYSLHSLEHALSGAIRAQIALGLAASAVLFIAFYTKSSASFSRVLFSGGIILSSLMLAILRAQMRSFVRWRCGGRIIHEIVICDGGVPIVLPGARVIDAAAHAITPALDDPVSLHRIGVLLRGVDRVTISCHPSRQRAWATILKGANIDGEVVDDAVARLGAQGARIVSGHGLLRVSVGPLGLRARALKRAFDLIFASCALIALAPLLLAVALAIRIEDRGPVLFVQRRVGRGNRFFDMIKFRSMTQSLSDPHGHRSTLQGDPRVTRVGNWIRRTSIDELPQLVNVLKGEMSIVGPRPHALGSQAGNKLFWEVDERYLIRHALKPGLTGLAQVRGLRGTTLHEDDLVQRLGADLEYLDGWSIWRDLAIIAATARVLVHPRAY
ncbi:sugar transferase [Novosphingobium sp.]|uniref:sugar transferase n=1 Tax=Novosphingobium sp. TaxID=1874826 RepID=UPI0035AF80C3